MQAAVSGGARDRSRRPWAPVHTDFGAQPRRLRRLRALREGNIETRVRHAAVRHGTACCDRRDRRCDHSDRRVTASGAGARQRCRRDAAPGYGRVPHGYTARPRAARRSRIGSRGPEDPRGRRRRPTGVDPVRQGAVAERRQCGGGKRRHRRPRRVAAVTRRRRRARRQLSQPLQGDDRPQGPPASRSSRRARLSPSLLRPRRRHASGGRRSERRATPGVCAGRARPAAARTSAPSRARKPWTTSRTMSSSPARARPTT